MSTKKQSNKDRDEALIYGGLLGILALTLLFNGFTGLHHSFGWELDGELMMLVLLEQSRWKYPLILILGGISFFALRYGIKKLKKKQSPDGSKDSSVD